MKAVAILAALALSACATAPIAGSPIRSDGLATFGQPTRVGNLVVTPIALVEDSRCPVNVRCVWAGQVVVSARIEGTGWRETANLTLGEPFATHGITVALLSAQPDKVAGATVRPRDYVFGFESRR